MTTTTHNIDTATATAAPAITDLQGLTNAVARLASLQLILNNAEGSMQAQVEALKKAFADATAEHAAEIKTTFAQVEAYCAANKETLFPIKNGKRKKTFAVLQHALQYRTGSSVEIPKDAVTQIQGLINYVKGYPGEEWNGLSKPAIIGALESLIRTPAPEFNKDTFSALRSNTELAALAEVLRLNGFHVSKQETFKLAFTFTPEQTQSA